MSKLKIQPIRAAILNELAAFVPEKYCRGADYGMDGWLVPEPYGIEQGSADIRLGQNLSLTNPAMTARQNAAATALQYLGWYVLAKEMHDNRQAAKAKQTHPTSETEMAAEITISSIFRKGRTHTEQLEIYRRNMMEAFKTYVQYLSDSEAKPILLFITDDMEPSLPDIKFLTNKKSSDDTNLRGFGMDCFTYEQLRAYCWQDLHSRIDTPKMKLQRMVAGGTGTIGDIELEYEFAMALFLSHTISPREKAAAHLLAGYIKPSCYNIAKGGGTAQWQQTRAPT